MAKTGQFAIELLKYLCYTYAKQVGCFGNTSRTKRLYFKEDNMYQIFINGVLTKPEEITVSAYPFNRTWPGKQRDPAQSETAYMLRVFGEGALEMEIETQFPISDAVLRPLSANIALETQPQKISFTVPQNGKYSIEINGVHHAIHLLYQKSTDYSAFPAPTYHFKSGHYDVGLLTLKSGDTVCIEKDAVVHGSLFALDAKDITIYGDGVLCGDWEVRTEKHGDLGFDNENVFDPAVIHTYGGIRMFRCENISLYGITVTDTASYAISFFATDGISIDDVNVLGLWKYNCDGIDFFNSANITVKNCFIRSFDDSMCMKGLTAFSDKSTVNADISNCVFWCDWGKNVDIGLATACPEVANITWRDCDFIHNSGTCITISCGQWADVHDIRYENIRIEYAKTTQKAILQTSDDQKYKPDGKPVIPALVAISDTRRNWQGNIASEDEHPKIRNIRIDGIYVFMEDGLEGSPGIYIKKTIQNSVIEKIQMQNVFVNGKRWDVSQFCMD